MSYPKENPSDIVAAARRRRKIEIEKLVQTNTHRPSASPHVRRPMKSTIPTIVTLRPGAPRDADVTHTPKRVLRAGARLYTTMEDIGTLSNQIIHKRLPTANNPLAATINA